MDSIDITSSEFSLGNIPNTNEVLSSSIIGGTAFDYTMYIYIGIAVLVLLIAVFIYKFYFNKEKRVTFQDKLDDCYGTDTCQR
jgi:hypothetical protein